MKHPINLGSSISQLVINVKESEIWSEWSKCRANQLCDEGIQVRKKTCASELCIGPLIKARMCPLTKKMIQACKSTLFSKTGKSIYIFQILFQTLIELAYMN